MSGNPKARASSSSSQPEPDVTASSEARPGETVLVVDDEESIRQLVADVLRDHVADEELSAFYGSLFESEARHHATYVRLAKGFEDDEAVAKRLEWLAIREAEIIAEGDNFARMHS